MYNITDVTDAVYSAIESGKKNIIIHIPCPSQVQDVSEFLKSNPPAGIEKVVYTYYNRHLFLYDNSMSPYSIDTWLKFCLTEKSILKDAESRSGDAKNYLLDFEESLSNKTMLIIDYVDIGSPTPYLRHLFGLDCIKLIITGKEMKNYDENVLYLNTSLPKKQPYSLDILDEKQYELLVTLCAFLSSLDNSVKIVSSKNGVFDEESVRFYLGDLADGLGFLCESGFTRICDNGRIEVNANVLSYVLSTISPDADICLRFMEFCRKAVDFRIMHNSKDIRSTLQFDGENISPIITSGEFLCLYSHFVTGDPDGITHLYNILMSYVLENLSMQKGGIFYHHLVMRNAPYYIFLLSENIHEHCEEIYTESFDEDIPDFIRADLDIIRICVCFMRGLTPDMYKRYYSVFKSLSKALENIIAYGKNSKFCIDERLQVLESAIELCYETFGFFSITNGGIFDERKSSFQKRRISYVCERQTDGLFGDSLVFGYNSQTVLLYSGFCRLIDMWLTLYDKASLSDIPLIRQIEADKKLRLKKLSNMIKSHYHRIVNGFDSYTDIENKRYFDDRIYNCPYDDFFEQKLKTNRHLSTRGYDRATISGAERYCESLMLETGRSDNPAECLLPVLSPFYPVSSEFYTILDKKDIMSVFFKGNCITNRSEEIFLESLIFQYSDCLDKDSLCLLYRKLIDELSDAVSQSQSFLERMYGFVSSMYVKCHIKGKITEFEDRLYKRYCDDTNFSPTYCDGYLAKAIYCKRNGTPLPYRKAKLYEAISIFAKENTRLTGYKEVLTEFIIG